MKYCPECGAALAAPTVKFCGDCGASMAVYQTGSTTPASAGEPSSTGEVPGSHRWASGQSSWELRGYFNVEGGNAAVSTAYFDECDCYLEPGLQKDCACGRNALTTQAVIAGGGDGCYPAFQLRTLDQTVSGAIAVFTQDWGQGMERSLLAPYDLVDAASPVRLGELQSDGMVYFNDSFTHWDHRNVSVDVELPAGTYSVVAWLAEVPGLRENGMEPFVRPIALAVYAADLMTELLRRSAVDRSVGAIEAVRPFAGMPMPVYCHQMPQWAEMAMLNAEADVERSDRLRAASWLLQATRHGSTAAEAALSTTHRQLAPETIDELLRSRGQRADEQRR